MTTLLERALEAVRRMSPQDQDAIAGVMLSMASINGDEQVDPEELREALAGLAEVDRGEIASADEVESAFRRLSPPAWQGDCVRGPRRYGPSFPLVGKVIPSEAEGRMGVAPHTPPAE